MSELVEGLYINVNSEVWTKASCLGSVGPKGQKLGCSGSAVIHHKFKEAKKQVGNNQKKKVILVFDMTKKNSNLK